MQSNFHEAEVWCGFEQRLTGMTIFGWRSPIRDLGCHPTDSQRYSPTSLTARKSWSVKELVWG
jgi:hypothetical protein